ncbi:MAG: prolyl oligopeptidase family serine peptidase [Breznakibacter sp.]
MKYSSKLIVGITFLATAGFYACTMTNERKLIYPVTAKVDTVDVYFGTQVADPYRWLEDDQSNETKAWVVAQNKLTDSVLSAIPYRVAINERLTKIWNFERMGIPFKKGGYYFFSKNNGLQNQSVVYIQKDLSATPEVILDPNTLSEKGTVALSGFSVSKDGKYFGYSLASAGSDWNEFFVKEISTDKMLDDHIKWVKFSGMEWHKDGFFYSRFPAPEKGDQLKGENKHNKVYYHRLGTSQEEDVLVYEDPSHPDWMYNVSLTDDEKYLVITVVESTTGNAVYFKDLSKPNSPVVKAVESFDNDFELVTHHNGMLVFLTNHNAPNYRLIGIDPKNPALTDAVEIIPAHEKDVLKSVSYVGGKVLANYTKDARSEIKVFDPAGKYLNDLELPSIGTAAGLYGGMDDQTTFYSFSSYTYPSVIYQYDVAGNKSEVFYQTQIDFDLSAYETDQVFYTSSDGTKVPMFVVHKKGIKLDGSHPVWLYGYGGFNISLNPSFDVRRLVWLENGGVYAVANLRGGGEYGETWHQAGTKLNKKNVFNDFVSAAEYLIDNGYTSPGRIVAQGGSNGGLLIGASINQAPELFGVAFPQVGVLDMLRYHKFTIGRLWATDYGTSEESQEMFEYLLSYSPLHNISADKNYPAVMVTTGDHDDRVVPAHSFKYAATLQNVYKGNNPMLIRIETEAGHGAGKPTSKIIEELADIYAFAFYRLGIEPLASESK